MLALQFRSGLDSPNTANGVGRWGEGEAVHLPTVSPGYKAILPLRTTSTPATILATEKGQKGGSGLGAAWGAEEIRVHLQSCRYLACFWPRPPDAVSFSRQSFIEQETPVHEPWLLELPVPPWKRRRHHIQQLPLPICCSSSQPC